MNKEEARQFKARWELVDKFLAAETRRTPPEVKLRQLALMHEAARELGWDSALRTGEAEVRERWRLLRERLGEAPREG